MKHTLLISAIFLACVITASPALCFAITTSDAKSEQLQIIGDYAESNKANKTFAAHGNVIVSITGQDANLEADDLLVDLNSATIDARGHVRITRHNELTTGSAFKFGINSNEYLITTSTTQVTGPSLSSRIGSGKPLVVSDVIVAGNRLIPADDILRVIKSKHANRFVRDRVIEDLKAIVALGYFDKQNICCIPELDTYGVILKFRVQENSPVYEFVVEGNKPATSHVTFAPSSPNYYGEDRYLPISLPNKHFGFRRFSYSEQDWLRLPFGRFKKPSSFLFTDWKFGTWKPIASKSSILVGSRGYGLKTPPKDLLQAMLLPNEQQSRTRKAHRNLSSLALSRAPRFSNQHKPKT